MYYCETEVRVVVRGLQPVGGGGGDGAGFGPAQAALQSAAHQVVEECGHPGGKQGIVLLADDLL